MDKEAFETFWYWINERQWVWARKYNGYPKPWSDDPIFQTWKFCNVFRRLDKQSQFLIERVINPHKDADPALLLFNIFMFRAFNWYPTYALLGWQEKWDPERAKEILALQRDRREQMTSGAYMIRGREGMPKSESIVMTLDKLWWEQKTNLSQIAMHNNSIHDVVEEIVEAKLWGFAEFTAYQIALDLTYSPLMPAPHDINSWCAFGPGAERGIKLIWPDAKRSQYLELAQALRAVQIDHLKTHVPSMNLQDIEFCLCELSKYMRIKNGGKSKEKYNGASNQLLRPA